VNDAFVERLHAWHDFFMFTGTAAATLMGLVFVAVSLGGNTKPASVRTLHTFVTPIVLHFGHVLFLAAVLLVPSHRPLTLALAVLALALVVLTRALTVLRGLLAHHRDDAIGRDKWMWNFVAPFVASFAATTAAVELSLGAPWALELLAGSSVLFLVTGVVNTWKLVIWILEHRAPSATSDD
jgi:hypothetical protein